MSAAARPRIAVVDPIHPAGVARLDAVGDLVPPDAWRDDPRAVETAVLVVRTTEIDAATIARLPRLRAIVKHGAGVDNIDIPAATRAGVAVANTPGGNNATAVAEGAVALMLALLRQVREMDGLVRSGGFDERWRIRLGDLSGARVGLVGFGRIARGVARICGAGFGARVAAHDPMVAPDDIRAAGVEPVDLRGAMGCDIVSVHAPLTPGTRGMIAARQLGWMPAHGIVVNCSRGGIIDEAALVDALRSGSIAGAGVDVFEAEPPPADHPLFALPNAILSPHVAGVTEAGMKGMALHVADVVDIVLAGGTPATILNPEAFA